MSELRRPARIYVAALGLVALAAVLLGLLAAPLPAPDRAALAIAIGGLMALAYLFPIPFAFKTKTHLDTGVILAAVLLFDPGLAALAVGLGGVTALLLRRVTLPEAIVNGAQAVLQAFAGGAVLRAAGWDTALPRFDRPGLLLAIPLAVAAMHLVNTLAVAAAVGLQTGQPFPRVIRRILLDFGRGDYVSLLSQAGLGLLAAAVVDLHAWLLLLLLFPAVAVQASLEHHTQGRRQAEDTLRGSEASLAVAQRIARLGSWEWDLTTGAQLWSDEVYRIVGLDPDALVPTYDTLLAAAHPDDRAAIDGGIHGALAAGTRFALEHRVRRPDGVDRTVLAQGEVVRDDTGHPVRMVGTIQDITERKLLEDQLAHLALHDPLTALPNRAFFTDRVARARARATRA